MSDKKVPSSEKIKKNGIKDLIAGVLIILIFGGLTLYSAPNNSIDVDWVTIGLLGLVTLQGIAVMILGIWELHLSRKYVVWDKETEELKLRMKEAQRALKEAREEAEELNTDGGPTNDTEANSTAD